MYILASREILLETSASTSSRSFRHHWLVLEDFWISKCALFFSASHLHLVLTPQKEESRSREEDTAGGPLDFGRGGSSKVSSRRYYCSGEVLSGMITVVFLSIFIITLFSIHFLLFQDIHFQLLLLCFCLRKKHEYSLSLLCDIWIPLFCYFVFNLWSFSLGFTSPLMAHEVGLHLMFFDLFPPRSVLFILFYIYLSSSCIHVWYTLICASPSESAGSNLDDPWEAEWAGAVKDTLRVKSLMDFVHQKRGALV